MPIAHRIGGLSPLVAAGLADGATKNIAKGGDCAYTNVGRDGRPLAPVKQFTQIAY